MGKGGRVTYAKSTGDGLLLASVAGLLGFGGNSALKSIEDLQSRVSLYTPGLDTSLRDSTIVILVFSAMVAVPLLVLLISNACEAKEWFANSR
jgi:hypothetical protein